MSQDVGTVTVRGLAAPVEMSPVEPGYFYTNPDPLPHPGFEPGDGIELVAAGGTGDPFRLLGVGVAPLAGTPAEITIEGDRDLALSWEGSTATSAVMVEITVNVNQHGLTGSRLVCEVPDSGQALIPASLVTALVDDGLSGFPSILLRRRSADSATRGGGCIDLQVLAAAEITVVVPGLASCNGDEDCPEGEVCRGDLTCGPPG